MNLFNQSHFNNTRPYIKALGLVHKNIIDDLSTFPYGTFSFDEGTYSLEIKGQKFSVRLDHTIQDCIEDINSRAETLAAIAIHPITDANSQNSIDSFLSYNLENLDDLNVYTITRMFLLYLIHIYSTAIDITVENKLVVSGKIVIGPLDKEKSEVPVFIPLSVKNGTDRALFQLGFSNMKPKALPLDLVLGHCYNQQTFANALLSLRLNELPVDEVLEDDFILREMTDALANFYVELSILHQSVISTFNNNEIKYY